MFAWYWLPVVFCFGAWFGLFIYSLIVMQEGNGKCRMMRHKD